MDLYLKEVSLSYALKTLKNRMGQISSLKQGLKVRKTPLLAQSISVGRKAGLRGRYHYKVTNLPAIKHKKSIKNLQRHVRTRQERKDLERLFLRYPKQVRGIVHDETVRRAGRYKLFSDKNQRRLGKAAFAAGAGVGLWRGYHHNTRVRKAIYNEAKRKLLSIFNKHKQKAKVIGAVAAGSGAYGVYRSRRRGR